ncbi:hypothetical protein ACFFX1_26865 [Dactylosporangium sucinum]|uniref:WxL domain-containing protein n=1 Tax=Dactylosporangium sucinum TaxID=1424081 RepID=A0A917T1R6_9ACTN|nr:hypothetical protein [Dactylosporangium sucinum]GGM05974.1 hypothetical protein GCM10007977_003900 [Dactylosporangium sucinum]
MGTHSRLAAAGALGLTAAIAFGGATAQAYGPTANSLGCRIYFSDAGTGTSPTTWNDTFALTQSPATPAPGQTVTVTFTAAAGPNNGPVPLNAGDVPVAVKLALGGSQSGTVTLNMATYPAAAAPASAPLGPITATGTYVAGAAGAGSLTVTQVQFNNSTAKTYCSNAGDRDHKAAPEPTTIVENFSVFGGGTTITSITGQTVTTAARAGNTVNFSVTGMAPSATLTASLKNAGGSGTGEGSGTGTTDATGAGAGTLAVPSGATTGARTLSVSDGTNTVTTAITILGAPAISITPGGGGAGTAVAVTGTNWNPGSTVTVRGYQAGAPPPPATADAAVTATATGAGAISASFTVNDPTTAYIGASSGTGPGTLFAVATWTASADSCVAKAGAATSGSCNLTYNLSQTVTAGNLAMSRAAGSGNVALSGVTLNGTVQNGTGALAPITVTDFRGSTFGWSLVGSVSDFTGTPGGTIPKASLTWTPTCTATAGFTNAVTATAGSAGAVDGSTLCSAPANAAGTGGSFDAAAALNLQVPAFQQAGSYTATLTITLS